MALRIAIRALWHLARNSRCWSSRQAALIALKAIALADEGVAHTAVEGLPDDPRLLLSERPDVLWPEVEDYLGMWSSAKPR